jgi:hypothetical protein
VTPFVGRLAATVTTASILSWLAGTVLFHLCHPQSAPDCPSGGEDLCGVLSGHWSAAVLPLVIAALFVVVVSALVLAGSRWTLEIMQGPGWWWRPGRVCQDFRRQRQVRRRALGRRHRCRYYPQGVPRKPTSDTPRANDVSLQPTLFGNVFAAAQQRILGAFGLRMSSCRWLLVEILSAEERTELSSRSSSVMRRVLVIQWAVLDAGWAFLIPRFGWQVLWVTLCMAVVFVVYLDSCREAVEYCGAIEAVLAVHRRKLYRAVGLPAPRSTVEEPGMGLELSGYLDRQTSIGHKPLRWDDTPSRSIK